MFNLKKSASELTPANSVGDMKYVQYSTQRTVVGDSFSNGTMHIKYTSSGRKWWVPKRSYIRMRVSLKDAAGAQLSLANDIAPNMNLVANLFQSMEFRINGQVVSRISDYVPQIDTLHKRLTKSKSWLESTGASTSAMHHSFNKRQTLITSNTTSSDLNILDGNYGGNNIGLDFTVGATNTMSAAANGVITFAAGGGAAIPALTGIVKVGDYLYFTDIDALQPTNGGEKKIRRVTAVGAATITVDTAPGLLKVSGARALLLGDVSLVKVEPTTNADALEFIWQPCLSIFNLDHALPSGNYELVLQPQTSTVYKQLAIESVLGAKVPGAGNDFTLSVVDMYLYVAEVEGPRVDNMSYYIDLNEINCQRRDVQAATGLLSEEFTVSPSTHALTLAFQDSRAGSSSTLYSQSKFKVAQADVTQAVKETNLTRMYIKYAGQNKPQPDADPSFKITSAEDYMTQRYADSVLYSGTYFSQGGAESINEYRERGAYYHFAWPKEQSDRSTRVTAHYQFSDGIANATCLLFSHFKKAALITLENGVVTNVSVEEM